MSDTTTTSNHPITIWFLNGPNANLYGLDANKNYGSDSFPVLQSRCEQKAAALDVSLRFLQSNYEGQLIDWIQEARESADALILNPAAYGHTSVALHDALKTLSIPVIELHLSNPAAREAFRHHSYVSSAATGVIAGFGANGYELAVQAALNLIRERP